MKKAIIHGLVGMIFFYIGSRANIFILDGLWRSYKFDPITIVSKSENIFILMLGFLLCYFPMYLLSGFLVGLFNSTLSHKRYNKKSLFTIILFCTILQISIWLLILPLWYPGDQLAGFATIALGFPAGRLSEPVYWLGPEPTVYFGWQTLLTISFFILSSAVFVLGVFIGGKVFKRKKKNSLCAESKSAENFECEAED